MGCDGERFGVGGGVVGCGLTALSRDRMIKQSGFMMSELILPCKK